MNRKPREDSYLRKVEYVFFNAERIRAAVADERSRRFYSEIKNPSKLSDPTAAEAVRNLTPIEKIVLDSMTLEKPELWLEVVDKVYRWCKKSALYSEVTKARYGNEHFAKTCARLEISVDAYYRIVDKVRQRAALYAAYARLIDLDF